MAVAWRQSSREPAGHRGGSPGGRPARTAPAGRARRGAVVAGLIAALLAATATAEGQGRAARAGESASRAAHAVVRAMAEYRAALVQALPVYEAVLRDAAAALEERRRLHEAGHLEAVHVQEAERAWRAARDELAEHRVAMAEADRILFTASVHERLARLAPLPANRFEDAREFVRFNGPAPWSPARLPAVAAAFTKAWGRVLEVSASGQTALHTRLGLDHRNAVDVAVHPDSAEGRWLVQHLRSAGIPFLGIRDAIPGSSTGPHIHIGAPSLRMLRR